MLYGPPDNIILFIERYDDDTLYIDVFDTHDIIDVVSSRVLKYGNIKNREGCVAGIDCNEKRAWIEAKFVFNRYAEKQLFGWYADCIKAPLSISSIDRNAYRQKYIREHRIQIDILDLYWHYRKVKFG